MLVGPAGCGKSRIAEWLSEVVHEEGTMVPLRAALPKNPRLARRHARRGPAPLQLRARRARLDSSARCSSVGRCGATTRMAAPGWQALGNGYGRWVRTRRSGRAACVSRSIRWKPGAWSRATRCAKSPIGRPLLFWLDDIHNASPATIEGLLKIHTDEPDQRIVMVATVRLEDVVMGTATAHAVYASCATS